MHSIRLTVLFAALNLIAPVTGPLRVLRVDPTGPAQPSSEITVTFDRPVAGSLDATVDARRLFSISPVVAGKVEWRDPVTLRFTPTTPLTPGSSYTVTVSNDFTALDGSRLEQPYTFTFVVSPPEVLYGTPAGPGNYPRFLTATPKFEILLSAAVDPAALAARTFIRLDSCGGARINLNPGASRRVARTDNSGFRYAGVRGEVRDTARDLRRIIELTPVASLPPGCRASLSVPTTLAPGAAQQVWPFRTYGPLEVLSAGCATEPFCATGPIRVTFSTPVRGSEVMRRVRIGPTVPFTISDTTEESDRWTLDLKLKPTEHYAVMIDSMMRDVFGQRLQAMVVKAFQTTSYAPSVGYDFGRMLVERAGLRTLAVQSVNVDTLVVTSVVVPQDKEAAFLGRTWGWSEPFRELLPNATQRAIPVTARANVPFFTGVPVPFSDAGKTRGGTLVAMRVTSRNERIKPDDEMRAIALVQVTDLAVHGRIGIDRGMVWVTGVHDGLPRAGAVVTLYDTNGKMRAGARTDAQGLATLGRYLPAAERSCEESCSFEGYISAALGDDRAVVGVSSYDPDLSPWRFGISGAWDDGERVPAAAALFTERGIYRPGESVYAKAIVRRGPLGALAVPPAGDSVKWIFSARQSGEEGGSGTLREKVAALSAFGTAQQVLPLPRELPLGEYGVQVQIKREGAWHTLAQTTYLVAEYRPPEFLVDVNADPKPRFSGDTITAHISARYLFGAPMARASVRWILQQRALDLWGLDIPNTEGWQLGGWGFDAYETDDYSEPQVEVVKEAVDTLDAAGALNLKVPLPAPSGGRGARMGILAVVTDANRQTVTAGTSVIVHPAAFYIAAKGRGTDYFWRAGVPVTLDVIAVRPTGERVSGVNVSGVVVRREWHRVRRTRGSEVRDVGGWVTDTVATCKVQTAAQPGTCTFTPPGGGSYNVILTARDAQRRVAQTVVWRWAAGADWVPWNDATQLKMDVIPDKKRYSVGDTATLLIASPFTNVEGWVTIERERVLESRRIRITSGATTIKVPITEALAPNAYVSVLVVRGRSAPPGPLDDPGRPTMRVGYAELRVLPAVKKLDVKIAPELQQYRPGDTARVRIAVKDAAGRGRRSEVTLWAVDEGVLSLTGYKTPDLIDLIYRERALGVRLASNLTKVAAQIPEGQKGNRAPGGGGGADIGGILRSRFQTTAFFLGSVITDATGNAIASAKLPDNLTTFRLMAVAVTTNDRYGSGQSSMLVTRPLVARPALPRFVREGDRFSAGVLVNSRTGGTKTVDVQATARGIALDGAEKKPQQIVGAAASEVRFDFRAQAGDSARFQFVARAGNDADAVAVAVPVRPNYHPVAQTTAGTLVDTATVDIQLGRDVDPERSRVEVSFGASPLAFIQGARAWLRVYPYYCSEQVSSAALPLIALYRARKQLSIAEPAGDHAGEDIATAVRVLTRRQNTDGGIGYWSTGDWTTPWLTSYAGRVLVEAKAAGVAVDDAVLQKIADYLTRSLHQPQLVVNRITQQYSDVGLRLGEQVAAMDLLSRMGRADVAIENTLLSQASQLRWEDRLLLAEALARRGQRAPAEMLLNNAWQGARQEGRRISLSAAQLGARHYFYSDVRPAARLLSATLTINPTHPLIAQLVETVAQHGRALRSAAPWNTQDLGASVLALMVYEGMQRSQRTGTLRIRGESRDILEQDMSRPVRDTTFSLSGLIAKSNPPTLRLRMSAQGQNAPAYYFVTVYEVPRERPVTPLDNGIQVERWYERLSDHAPIMSAPEGELVRVRLRIRVPAERQFVVLDDPLPAGLEAVDLSLRTVSPFGQWESPDTDQERQENPFESGDWSYGSWDSGMWSPFDHKELRDERVVYSASLLWPGTYSATYLARATTAGTFILPPAHAEEMYNPAVNGRTGGSVFTVTTRAR